MMPVIVQQLARWFFSRRPMLGSFLCGLLVVSSLGVAYSSHETRNMYRDLQQLEKDHDDSNTNMKSCYSSKVRGQTTLG
jgi:cell division protein FtsL